LIESHASDLGGLDMLSEAQKSLIRRAAALEIELEALEGKLSRGEAIDLDMFGRLSGHLRRVLETVGIQRVARPVDVTAQERINAFWERKRARGLVGGDADAD
jgi:hypothetical protein